LQLDFSTIKNKRIGIPRGYPTIELIEKRYGKVNFVEVDSVDEGLLMLSRGELYAFTDLLSICSYSMQKQILTNLKVAGHLDISIPINMSIRSDMPELVSIFNKVLGDIDKSTINALYAKWIKVEYNVIMDWKTLIKYLLLAIIALGIILYWMRKLYLLNCNLNKANAKLELLNETDALSKMKNRNFVTFQLPLLMKLAHRNRDTLNLAILDIDHFKHLNDTYGHDMGDKCIVAVSHKIRTIFHREDDWIIRYGGDEFVIVSIGIQKQQFEDELNILRDEVENLIIDTNKHIPCSISIGYVYHPLAPKEWHEGLIAEADKKLYEAKQSGRNKIVGS
jgi:diguanylate cyclase (GGDEF)-like protein